MAITPNKILNFLVHDSGDDSSIFVKFIKEMLIRINENDIKNYIIIMNNSSINLTN